MTRNLNAWLLPLLAVPFAFVLGFFVIGPRLCARPATAPQPIQPPRASAPPPPAPPPPRKRAIVTVTRCPAEALPEEQQADEPQGAPPSPEDPAASPSQSPAPDQAAPDDGDKLYRVQVGAFSTIEAARSLSARLTSAGYDCTILPITRDGQQLHCVQVGEFTQEPSARKAAEELRARGLDVYVVGPQ